MNFEFYRVGTGGDLEGSAALNKALAAGGIVSIRKEFVQNADASYWAFCIERVRGKEPTTATRKISESVDYKQLLTAEEFKVYSKLREVRKRLAAADAVPAFSIATNEQLSQIVKQRVASKSGFLQIEGFGQSRVDKYGAALLEVLSEKEEEVKS
jgi:superfamily II DNA helicase RecQ